MKQYRLFLGCFLALVATAFAFAVRAGLLEVWRVQFELSNEEVGQLQGAGLYPFAISIVLFSLIVDRLGYGWSMLIAFLGHTVSALLSIFAFNFEMLYFATFLFALSNGVVEAVINPVVATMYDKNKTHWLNILHAGWPGGLVVGGLLSILILLLFGGDGKPPENLWRWQMGILLIPTAIYGVLLLGQKFPVQERVAAGVSYMDMLKEFGAISFWIVCFFLVAGLDQILQVLNLSLKELAGLAQLHELLTNISNPALATQLLFAAIAVVPTIVFALVVQTAGRPMFVFLLLIMVLLATTELGTDGWISDIMGSVLKSNIKGQLFLVYTSLIMFVLRFFAGPIVHRISPLGLLAVCAGIAAVGLVSLSWAGSALFLLFLAATLYGFGKTFFWPTTLGVVSEQYPKGGALMLNAIAGVGMLAVGTLGNPVIGILQDRSVDTLLSEKQPAIHSKVVKESQGLAGTARSIDQVKKDQLSPAEKTQLAAVVAEAQQSTLATIAVLPTIMFISYLILIAYFRSRGGYQAQTLGQH